jgi:osmotically-inducible protein OsmY
MPDRIARQEKAGSTRSYEEPSLSSGTIPWQNSPEIPVSDAGDDAAAKSVSPAGRRLSEQIIRVLRATGYLPLRDLEIFAAEGFVILRGRVPSYYLKQVAQAAVLGLPGVDEVRNELDVISCGVVRP